MDVEFEYRAVPGIHHGWRLERAGIVLGDALESLSDVEGAIDHAMTTHCRDHSAAITLVRGGHGWRDFTTAPDDVVSFCWTLIERDFRCADCGYDTWDETYRVADSLWAVARNVDGPLCIGCLERRLNRPLTPEDFVDDELNIPGPHPRSQRLRDRQDPPARPPRPDITFNAPIGSVDLRAFDEVGDTYEITACPDCLPWHAEVVRDPETNETLVREWHAVECPLFQDLIANDDQ
jgi:hypothetical protein